MEIAYNKKRLQASLYISVVWLLLGVFQMILMKDQPWLGFGWIVLAALFFISFLYKSRKKYITITNQFIKQNLPFGKTIKLSDIRNITYFSEDYIIKTDTEEIRINTNLVEEESLENLRDTLFNINKVYLREESEV